MIITRPLRRLNVQQLALDTPLPFVVTCAGMRLSWPYGSRQEAVRATGEPTYPLCACGNPLPDGERICADCDAFADATIGVGTGPH